MRPKEAPFCGVPGFPRRKAPRLAEKTRFGIDDVFVRAIARPIAFLSLVLGIFLAGGCPGLLDAKGEEIVENRVRDASFEQAEMRPSGGGVGHWTVAIHGESDATITMADGEGRNGSRCVRYTKTQQGSQNIHVDQIVSVNPETIYEVRAWVRGDGALRPVLAVQTMDWDTLAAASSEVGADWHEVRFLFHSQGNDRVRFEWFPGSDGGLYRAVAGASWLDEVSIREMEDPSAEIRRGFTFTRTRKGDEMDLTAIRAAPIGKPSPIRPIVCEDGALRYEGGGEVALFGVNFQTALSWEYRDRLGKYGLPLDAPTLKRVADENLDQIERMGAGVIRMHLLPGDLAGAQGDLHAEGVFLDSLDYTIAQCRERGIYVYLTLLNEMGAPYFEDSFLGGHNRAEWITNESLVAKTERYIQALLEHENRYTHVAYADDPTIAVVEIMNEPDYVDYGSLRNDERYADLRERFEARGGAGEYPEVTYPAFRYEYVKAYLNRMCSAVRDAGCAKPVGWSLNWPHMIGGHEDVFQAVADSDVEVVSFCLYPGQDDVPSDYWYNARDLSGKNYLPFLRENYGQYVRLRWVLGGRFVGKAKMVYEFETFFNQTTYLYPAMARLFRALGVQVACMWTYTLSPSSEYFTGSHLLNLECTPGKAVSFSIAERLFRDTPRYAPYNAPKDDDLVFGNCALSYARDLSVLCTEDTFMQTRSADWLPLPLPKEPRHIAGCGDSPFVQYGGTGAYFVEVREDTIDIEIMPDVTRSREHWNPRHRGPFPKVCHLDRETSHGFALTLSGWQGEVTVWRIDGSGRRQIPATGLAFDAKPGTYRVERTSAGTR